MNDDENDFDRILRHVNKITAVAWGVSRQLSQDRNPVEHAALETACRELNTLAAWVSGLADSHRSEGGES